MRLLRSRRASARVLLALASAVSRASRSSSNSSRASLALRSAAEVLEHHSRTHGLEGVDAMLASIKNEFARAEAELNQLLGK